MMQSEDLLQKQLLIQTTTTTTISYGSRECLPHDSEKKFCITLKVRMSVKTALSSIFSLKFPASLNL